MNDRQLFAVIGVPSIITLVGMAHENRRFEARFEAMEKRMDGIDMRLAAWIRPMDPTIGSMQAEGNNIRRGLQVFFRYFGRHEEAIEYLKSKL